MKPRVLYYEVLEFLPENQKRLEGCFDLVRLESPDRDTPELLSTLDAVVAPLKYQWDAAKIDAGAKLRVIASCTGLNAHIDVDHANARGIKVIHLQGEFEDMRITSTPEHTFGLILNLTRRVPWAHKAVVSEQWNRNDWVATRMLSNSELGIVGLGRVGQRVAGYGTGFGMKVRYFDPYVDGSPVEGVSRVATLEELVAQSDIVTLHVMLSEENRNLINKNVLDRFRSGSFLINAARGPLVDSAALLEALEHGPLAGAALDVIPEEFDHDFTGDVGDHPLVQYARMHDNLLITPHIAGSTLDSWGSCQVRIIEMLAEALEESR